MPNLLETFQMETHFQGLIQLLAKHLYSEPDVFIRELIQNAHDGIVRRLATDSNHAGRIHVTYESASGTITFKDNGLGMDRHDIRAFLATIGSTGTGAARDELQEKGYEIANDLIGQFGIGLLSAFVVADKVVVRTRKVGAHVAFAWHNAGSTDCDLYDDDLDEAGSEVTVFVSKNTNFLSTNSVYSRSFGSTVISFRYR